MPLAKKSRKSNKAAVGSQYTAELSSSQLVVGIAILLIFGLACFLFGVLIGKFDPSLRQQQAAQTSEQPDTDPTTEPSTSSPTTKETTDTKPTQPNPGSKTVEEKTIVVSRAPTLKPVIEAPQVPQSAQPKSDEPISPSITDPTSAPTPSQPKVAIPENTPIRKIKVSSPTKPVTTPSAAPVKPAKPESSTWSVQIAAFKIRSNAEAEQARLAKTLPHTIEIFKPEGSIWTKLLVGSYASRNEADQMRKKLVSEYALQEPGLFERK